MCVSLLLISEQDSQECIRTLEEKLIEFLSDLCNEKLPNIQCPSPIFRVNKRQNKFHNQSNTPESIAQLFDKRSLCII